MFLFADQADAWGLAVAEVVFKAYPELAFVYGFLVQGKRAGPDLKQLTDKFKQGSYCRYGCIRTMIR